MDEIIDDLHQKYNELPENFKLIKKLDPFKKKGPKCIEDLNGDFKVLSHTTDELIEYATMMLTSTSYCSTIFTPRVTKKMVAMIEKNYNKISYHNFAHAFYLTLVIMLLLS